MTGGGEARRERPPRLARVVMGLRLPARERSYVLADLDDRFDELRRDLGPARARLWYWRQALLGLTRVGRWHAGHGRQAPAGGALDHVVRDLKGAMRGLSRRPLQACSAVVMIGVGIGLSATAFTVLYGTVLRGLPFPDSGRLVHFERSNPAENQLSLAVTPHDYADWRTLQTTFEDLGAYVEAVALLANEGAPPSRFDGLFISANSFGLLQVGATRGRTLLPEDEAHGAPPVVVLGHALWSSRFGADPDLVGQAISLNGVPTTVVGIMPEGFGFPVDEQIWLPLRLDLAIPRGSGRLDVFGRLAPGVTIDAARQEFGRISASLAQSHPVSNGNIQAVLRSFTEEYVGPEFIRTVYRMLAGAALVLLLGCINVMHLLLAHTSRRSDELAVRTALGASRGRLVRQLLTETGVLAAAGALAGWVLTHVGVGWFNAAASRAGVFALPHGPSSLFWWDVRVDGTTIVCLVALTFFVAVVAGAVPAYRGAAVGRMAALGRAGRLGSNRRAGRFASHLVLAETALSAALLTVGGFVVQSTLDVAAADDAIDPSGVQTTRVDLPISALGGVEGPYVAVTEQVSFAHRLLDRLRSMPDIEAAAIATGLPLSRPRLVEFETVSGGGGGEPSVTPSVGVATVSPGYFEVLGVSPVAGRLFNSGDREGSGPVALVNEAFLGQHLPGGWGGAQVRMVGEEAVGGWLNVVGVVPSLWEDPRDPSREAGLYLPLAQSNAADAMLRLGRWELRFQTVLLKTRPGSTDLGPRVRDAVFAEDPDLPLRLLSPLADVVEARLARYGLWGRFYLVFAVIGLLLAAVGVYGVMAFGVEGRTREIGVRRALGATSGGVAAEVVFGAARRIAVGSALGLVLGYWLAQGLSQVFYGLDTTDLRVWMGVAGLMLTVGILSSWLPARRAARIHPADAVRAGA